jgi:hypothetical protein
MAMSNGGEAAHGGAAFAPLSSRETSSATKAVTTPVQKAAGLVKAPAVPAPSTSTTAPAQATTAPAQATPLLAPAPPTAPAQPSPAPPSSKVLDYQFQLQVNGYYCGPAATRIALTARGKSLSQAVVASALGTTTGGTDSAHDTTRALNSLLGGPPVYRTHLIRGNSATAAERDQFQSDVIQAITNGYVVVANIVGSATDLAGGGHGYGGGHYVTVVGYRDDGRTVKVADPANQNVDGAYWMTVSSFANWMAHRGYSA